MPASSRTHSRYLSHKLWWIFFIMCCAFLVVSELCAKFFMPHRQKGRFSLTKKFSVAVLDVVWKLIMHKHTKKDANFVVTHPCVHYLLKFPSTRKFCMLKHVLRLNNLHIRKKSSNFGWVDTFCGSFSKNKFLMCNRIMLW